MQLLQSYFGSHGVPQPSSTNIKPRTSYREARKEMEKEYYCHSDRTRGGRKEKLLVYLPRSLWIYVLLVLFPPAFVFSRCFVNLLSIFSVMATLEVLVCIIFLYANVHSFRHLIACITLSRRSACCGEIV